MGADGELERVLERVPDRVRVHSDRRAERFRSTVSTTILDRLVAAIGQAVNPQLPQTQSRSSGNERH